MGEKSELVWELQEEHFEDEMTEQNVKKNNAEHTAKVRSELQEQRRIKEATQRELQELRLEVERGGLSDEERLQIWKRRTATAQKHLLELKEENKRLRLTWGYHPEEL